MNVKLIGSNPTHNYVDSVLKERGIIDLARFKNPDESCLEDFKLLEGIDEGVEFIKKIKEQLEVKSVAAALIVDCDCDGYTSASILYLYLKRLFPKLSIKAYIHSGKAHGLEEHWEALIDGNYDVIFVPDAGSNDSQYADQIKKPILVLDHHLVEEPISSQYMTVINNQLSPRYENKDLSGAGVVYQFCRALDEEFGNDWAKDYIDLASLGICGDMMSALEVENQYFWRAGRTLHNYFYKVLANKQAYSITGESNPSQEKLSKSLTPNNVGFYISPLINGMVRSGSIEEKERMFLAFIDGHKFVTSHKRGAKGTLEEVAVESARECTNAKNHQNKEKEEITARLEQKIYKNDLLENQILFIRLDDDDVFPSELNGLVAMQLSQKYKRPTIVARLNDEGYIRGSARGLNESQLKSFKDYLDSTGLFEYTAGHDQAFGISIPKRNLSKLHELANEQLKKYEFGQVYYEANFQRQALQEDIKDIIYDIANNNQLWGQQNPEPIIYVTDLHFSSSEAKIMGKNLDTVKVEKNGITYIKFFAKDLIEELKTHSKINMKLVGKANLNVWMGTVTPQIKIEDYELKEDSLFDF